jgi:antitoxin HicB
MNRHDGSTLDSLFEELGELDEVNAGAVKKILAVQAERRMGELGLTATALAAKMRTSRNQIHRILDRDDAGITLKMLLRLSQALRLPLRVTFEPPMPRAKARKVTSAKLNSRTPRIGTRKPRTSQRAIHPPRTAA